MNPATNPTPYNQLRDDFNEGVGRGLIPIDNGYDYVFARYVYERLTNELRNARRGTIFHTAETEE